MTIDELRAATQGGKLRQDRPWLYFHLQRWPSIYITRALLNTRATPNLITAKSVATGLAGAVLIAAGYIPFGIVLLYIGILLDKADGELARARRRFSLLGIYLDYVGHLVIQPAFFIALGIVSGALLPWGMLAAFASVLIRAQWGIPAQIYAKKYSKSPDDFRIQDSGFRIQKKRYAFFARLYHQPQDFLSTLIIALIAAITYPGVLRWVVIACGIPLPLIFVKNFIKGLRGIERTIRKFHIES